MPQAINRLKRISPEVFYTNSSFVCVDTDIVTFLKDAAANSPKSRARLCTHADPSALQQEMLIVMHRDSYVAPHRHLDKSETVTVLEGQATALLFSEAGAEIETIDMDPYSSNGCFFYRMPKGVFHSLLFRSEWFVFLETTIGPFTPKKSQIADWAPPESHTAEGLNFLRACVKNRKSL